MTSISKRSRARCALKAAGLALGLFSALFARPGSAGEFEVRDAWAQPAAGGTVEIYFTLINKGGMGFLLGVEADDGVARFCTEAGTAVTGIAPDCGQIDRMMLAGDDRFTFDRRDVFVQLSDFDDAPVPGDDVAVRLLFADGTKVAITAPLADRET